MLSGPTRISFRFSMTHIHGNVHRQRHVREHSTVLPLVTVSFPKNWLRNVLLPSPVPILVAPQCRHVITARQKKVQVLAGRYLLLIKKKSRDGHHQSFKFIFPAELFIAGGLIRGLRPLRDNDYPPLKRG